MSSTRRSDRISLSCKRGTVLFFLKLGPSPFKCRGDTIPCPCLVGSAPKDDTVENRQGQGIMSPKVICGQPFPYLRTAGLGNRGKLGNKYYVSLLLMRPKFCLVRAKAQSAGNRRLYYSKCQASLYARLRASKGRHAVAKIGHMKIKEEGSRNNFQWAHLV